MNSIKSAVRIKELDTLNIKLITIYNENTVVKGDNYLQGIMNEMEDLGNSLTEAINRDRMKNDLPLLDEQRNEAIHSLGKTLKGYQNVPIENLSKPAERLNNIFEKYGMRMKRESYNEKSASIESLLMDYDNEQARNDANQLQGINECLQKMKSAELEFRKLSIKLHTKNYMQKSASKLRTELKKFINKNLVTYLNTMSKVNPQNYSHFTWLLNEQIDYANSLVERREKRTNDNDPQVVVEKTK